MALGTQEYISKLRGEIQDSLVATASEESFLPSAKLHSILTLSAIHAVVTELHCGPEHRINLADTIYYQGRTVFAILVYNGWQDHIIDFRKHGALDSRFPLTEDDAVVITNHEVGRRLVREQWMFLPYTFPQSMWEHDCHVERKIIIPLIKVEQIGSGAFSTVEKIGISPSQQNFVDNGTEMVQAVRKRLNTKGNTKEFDKEVKCLRLLNQLRHTNIIPLWGCYTYRGEQNFIFPYLDMDLGRFLLAKLRHKDFQWDCTFYSALAGLASALSKTHRLLLNQADHDVDFDAIGYHHDLRPPNVLVNADNFVLADFGLGNLKRSEESSHTPYKSISGDYIAPECTDMEELPQTVNRAIDVWAFGCLMAEVITYMLKGADGVVQFREKRLTPGRFPQWKDASFYQPDGTIKQEVIIWMRSLVREHSAQHLVPQLIEITLDALQPDVQLRPKINDVYRRLAALSVQKQFHSVRNLFREVQGPEPSSTPLVQRRMEGLQFAEKRFEVWGFVLALSEGNPSDRIFELSDNCAGIMKCLLNALTEESQNMLSGDNIDQISLPRLIVQKVENLWTALPEDMLHFAKNQWEKSRHKMDSTQRINPHYVNADKLTAQPTSATDSLHFEFEEAARLFINDLPASVPFSEFSGVTNISVVYDITDKIQAEQHQSGGLRNLSKIQPYLMRLEGYTTVIDEIIHGDRQILASIWGPITCLLQRAAVLDEAYDSLINAIVEAGQYLPDFQASASLLNRSIETKEITVLFYKDIMNLYRELLQPFIHQHWMHVFDRLWPKHFASVKEVGRHLGRLTRLMRTEIRLEHIQEEYEFRKRAMATFKAQTADIRRQEYHRIMTSFSPCTYDKTLNRLNSIRCKGTGNWLFQSQIFLDWMGNSREESRRILWMKGIPGAGKTVLSSAIVNYLKRINGTKTAFAFLTYQEARTSALSAMHSLIFQLVGDDENLISVFCESICDSIKSNLTTAGNLLASLVRCTGPAYLILDGVDEISGIERGQLVAELLRLSKSNDTLKVIFSARPEADLMRLLDDTAAAINIHEQNEGNIHGYIDERVKNIFHVRNVFPQARAVIIRLLEPLVKRANGMFLYARLIMDMVATAHDLSEIENELAVLPENLDDAYHRIIIRLGGHKNRRWAAQARRLLGWIACTSAPMTIDEAQQALIVRPNDRNQSYNIVAKLNVVEILGPIVEIADTYIRFVHFTAKEYISSPHLGAQIINTTEATLDLAGRCVSYLCQRHHDTDLTQEEISYNVCTGQYVLHAFSVRMWLELIIQHLQESKKAGLPDELAESIQILWQLRRRENISTSAEYRQDSDIKAESAHEVVFEVLKAEQPQVHQILQTIYRFRNSSFLFTGNVNQEYQKDADDPMSISNMSQCIRRAFNDNLCKSVTHKIGFHEPCHQKCADILQYYGPRPFKCRFPQCEFWRHGFEQRGDRDRHELLHDKPLKCHVSGCEFEVIGFLSEKMRKDHIEKAHQYNSSALHREIYNPTEIGIETILSDLVKDDDLEAVERMLSKFPAVLSSNSPFKSKLLRIVAFQGSSSMLTLIDGDVLKDSSDADWLGYVETSIQGRNLGTLSYLLDQKPPVIRYGHSYFDSTIFPVNLLLSTDWYDGTNTISKWFRNGRNKAVEFNRGLGRYLFGGKHVIQKAAKCPNGNRHLLCLWEESGIASLLARESANRILKYVAQVNCSLDLVEFWLGKGVDVNWRSSRAHKTMLHHAAQHTSQQAALVMEMLLLHGANPEDDQHHRSSRKRIRDEEGARDIHKWLGLTWDELIERTKQQRKNKEACRTLVAQIEEEE